MVHAAIAADGVYRNDVGMVQIGEDAHFRIETLQDRRRTILIDRHHLDGDMPFHEHMFGEEDHSHGAGSESVEHAMVAEDQSMRGADHDSIELIFR